MNSCFAAVIPALVVSTALSTTARRYENGQVERGGKLVALKKEYFINVRPLDVRFSSGERFVSKDYSSWYADSKEPSYDAVVLVGDLIYWVRHLDSLSDTEFHLAGIFSKNDSAEFITALSVEQHKERVVAYLGGRRDAIAKIEGKNDAEKLAAIDAELAEEKKPLSAEEKAKLDLAMGLESITVLANASGPKGRVQLTVVATLEDGSTMKISNRERIYRELFSSTVNRYDSVMHVEVKMIDDETVKFFGEIPYSFDNPQSFECNGKAGLLGRDHTSDQGLYYNGQPGQDAPAVTVEIAKATQASTSDGHEILRYHIRCGDLDETFDSSAASEVTIRAIGGKGGHGIPRATGDGTNGGNGGDGGDIRITVDPAVKNYALKYVLRGGAGGNASDPEKSNPYKKGSPGTKGADGSSKVVRAEVSIP